MTEYTPTPEEVSQKFGTGCAWFLVATLCIFAVIGVVTTLHPLLHILFGH